jgi:hypothetical protein
MRKMMFTFVLSLGLAIVAVTILAEQGHTGRGRRRRPSGSGSGPKVGEMAPTFKLMSLDGKVKTDLASFRASSFVSWYR